MKKQWIMAVLLSTGFISCKSVSYKDPAQDGGSKEWGPYEVKLTVESMTTSLQKYFSENKKDVFLAVDPVKNRTSEHIDTRMLMDTLTTELLKKKFKFIDRSKRKEALKEIEAVQSGIVEGGISAGQLKSPNYLIYGEITDNVRSDGSQRLQYLVVTLKVTELSTGVVEWQEQKSFLKSSAEKKLTW